MRLVLYHQDHVKFTYAPFQTTNVRKATGNCVVRLDGMKYDPFHIIPTIIATSFSFSNRQQSWWRGFPCQHGIFRCDV